MGRYGTSTLTDGQWDQEYIDPLAPSNIKHGLLENCLSSVNFPANLRPWKIGNFQLHPIAMFGYWRIIENDGKRDEHGQFPMCRCNLLKLNMAIFRVMLD
jgi:hypothetical protein